MNSIRLSFEDYKDALEFTKDVLSSSSSLEEIIINSNIKIEEDKRKTEQYK